MQLKRGRFGPFLGCTGYPECRNIRKIGKSGAAAPAPVPLDEKCPVDGAQLVRRFGRFGEFISCSNYPKCKYIKQETYRRFVSASGMQRRDRREEIEAWKGVLWLFGVSELQRGLLGQAGARNVSAVQRAVSAREDDEEAGTFRYCANEECGYNSNEAAEINR